MSNTYTIVCTDCKEAYWCGQGYHTINLYEHAGLFMFEHIGHNLIVVSDLAENFDFDGYKDVRYQMLKKGYIKFGAADSKTLQLDYERISNE